MGTVDAKREIRRAVDTGRVLFGTRQSEKSLLTGSGKLVIVSSNTVESVKEKLLQLGKVAGVPVYKFGGNAASLGSACGKPFVVSAMAVEGIGKSKVMDLVKAVKGNA